MIPMMRMFDIVICFARYLGYKYTTVFYSSKFIFLKRAEGESNSCLRCCRPVPVPALAIYSYVAAIGNDPISSDFQSDA